PMLLALAPTGSIPRLREVHVDATVLAFTLGVSVVTGMIFGLAPALTATRRELRDSLAAGARTLAARRGAARDILAVCEISLALVLLIAAGLMVKSFIRLRSVNLGFRPENVIAMTVNLPESIYRNPAQMHAFHARALERLATLPGVEAAAAVNWLPLGKELINGDFTIEGGRELPPGYVVNKPAVSADYFRAIGIRVLQGRAFTAAD